MMTGLWPHQTGVTANNINLPATTPCYPELLAGPDYRAAQIGKWHLGDELSPITASRNGSAPTTITGPFTEGRDKKPKSHYWHFLNDELGLL